MFRLPAKPDSVCVVSRAAVPAELGVARDERPPGVALRRIRAFDGLAGRIANELHVAAAMRYVEEGEQRAVA